MIGMSRAGTACYFYRNLQGDVTEIYTSGGNSLAKYGYEAYGKCTVLAGTNDYNLANANPIRYRGYYYDDETDFYCLGARYYDPQARRFISPDDTAYIDPQTPNGLNLYCYCGNDPVNFVDPSGHFGVWAILGLVLAATVLGGGIQVASNALAGETGDDLWRGVPGSAIGAGVSTAIWFLLPGGSAAFFFAVGAGALTSTSIDTIESYAYGEDLSWEQATLDFGANFAVSAVSGYLGGIIMPINSGWFKPQKFVSVFTKPYGQKLISQSAIDAIVSGIVNYFKKIDWIKFLKSTLTPEII